MSKISFSGNILYLISLRTKDIALQNINKVFSDSLNATEKKCLLKKYYSKLALFIKEFFLLLILKERMFFSRKLNVKNIEKLTEMLNQKKGVILLTAHFFNWEYLPLIPNEFEKNTKFKDYNKKFFCIRKKLRFEFLDNIIFKISNSMNMFIIPRDQAMQKSLRELKKGNILIFTFDLNPKNYTNHKVKSTFLGYDAETYASLAWLVKKTGAVVMPMYYSQKNKKIVDIEFLPALEWIDSANEEQEIKLNTQLYNDIMGEMIKKCPENWLWSVKRWN